MKFPFFNGTPKQELPDPDVKKRFAEHDTDAGDGVFDNAEMTDAELDEATKKFTIAQNLGPVEADQLSIHNKRDTSVSKVSYPDGLPYEMTPGASVHLNATQQEHRAKVGSTYKPLGPDSVTPQRPRQTMVGGNDNAETIEPADSKKRAA